MSSLIAAQSSNDSMTNDSMTSTTVSSFPPTNESVRSRPRSMSSPLYAETNLGTREILVVKRRIDRDTAQIVREYGRLHSRRFCCCWRIPETAGKGYRCAQWMLHARATFACLRMRIFFADDGGAETCSTRLANGPISRLGSGWLRAELQTSDRPLYRQAFAR